MKLCHNLNVILLGATLGACAIVQADTHYVNKANMMPSSPFESWSSAATNIQSAIDFAAAGDVILVTNGVYNTGGRANWPAGSLLTNRVVLTNSVIVMAVSANPADTLIVGAADTVGGAPSNGPSAVRCAYVGANCTLAGFTLTNGYTSTNRVLYLPTTFDGEGGGVLCQPSVNLTISNCIVTACRAALYGGGVCSEQSSSGLLSGLLVDCLIAGNRTLTQGGGVYNGGMVMRCTVSNNYALSHGGGILVANGGNGPTIRDCRIVSNTSGGNGGGAYGVESGGTNLFINCLVADNIAASGGGLGSRSGYSKISAYDCVIVNNGATGSGGGMYAVLVAMNCSIVSNYSGSGGAAGGVYEGALTNCLVRYNRATESAGLKNCSAVNCLIANNTATTAGWGALSASVLESCTVVDNVGKTARYSCTFTNCIVFGNGGMGGFNTSEAWRFVNSCADTNGFTYVVTNILWQHSFTNDPQFASAAGNYHLSSTRSPCFNAGANQSWMTNAVDLGGKQRVRHGTVDMGAYELWVKAGTIFRGK